MALSILGVLVARNISTEARAGGLTDRPSSSTSRRSAARRPFADSSPRSCNRQRAFVQHETCICATCNVQHATYIRATGNVHSCSMQQATCVRATCNRQHAFVQQATCVRSTCNEQHATSNMHPRNYTQRAKFTMDRVARCTCTMQHTPPGAHGDVGASCKMQRIYDVQNTPW